MNYNRVISQILIYLDYSLWYHKDIWKKIDQLKIMGIYSQKTSHEMNILWILQEWLLKNVHVIVVSVDV